MHENISYSCHCWTRSAVHLFRCTTLVSFWYILWQSAWLPHLGLERCMHQQPLLGLRCANVHTNELLFVKNCLKMQWVSVAIQCTFEVVVPQTRLQRFHLLLCMIICFAYASQLIACITSASLSRRTNHYAFLIWVTCIENLTNGDVVRLIAFKALKLYIVALCTSTMYPHVFIVDHHADTRRIAHRDWRRLQCGSHVRCNLPLIRLFQVTRNAQPDWQSWSFSLRFVFQLAWASCNFVHKCRCTYIYLIYALLSVVVLCFSCPTMINNR